MTTFDTGFQILRDLVQLQNQQKLPSTKKKMSLLWKTSICFVVLCLSNINDKLMGSELYVVTFNFWKHYLLVVAVYQLFVYLKFGLWNHISLHFITIL